MDPIRETEGCPTQMIRIAEQFWVLSLISPVPAPCDMRLNSQLHQQSAERPRKRESGIEGEEITNYLNNSTASYCEKLHYLGGLRLLLKTGDGFLETKLHREQTGAGL